MFKKTLIAGIILLTPLFALAASVHIGDYFLKGSETASDDIYALGGTATFAGNVEGDAFAAGKTIFSQSKISGDAFFVGEEVRIGGEALDDARLVGATVTVDGTVSDDVVTIGSRVVIGPTAVVRGSLYVIGDNVEVYGAVRGDAKIFSNKLTLVGSVEGDLELWGRAVFKEPARIGGDFIHHSRGQAITPVNVAITGKVIIDEEKRGGKHIQDALIGGFFSLKILMMLALGFLLFFLARERSEEILLETLPNFWVRALRGFLIIFLLPLAILLLLPSVIGIPIALILLSLLTLLLLLSWVYAGILLGAWCEQIFFRRSAFPLSYRPVLLGILFISVIGAIPFIGPIFHGMLILASAGSLGTLFFRRIRARI